MTLDSFSLQAWDDILIQPEHMLAFNGSAFAKAGVTSGNAPFIITINDEQFLAFKRHHSLTIPSISLQAMSLLLLNMPSVKANLAPLGIQSLTLNTINADNNKNTLAKIINLNCSSRYEYALSVKDYQRSKLSNNHKRNIKKAEKANLTVKDVSAIDNIQRHITIVNDNLLDKGVEGLSSPITYFESLIQSNAGKLIQIFKEQTLIASTFFFVDKGVAYYHSSGTNDEGKAVGAAYYLVEQSISLFEALGIEMLNLGGCTVSQKGLIRFKQGFRAQPRVLLSAHRKLTSSWKQKVRSLLTLKPADVLQVDKVHSYLKTLEANSALQDKLVALDFELLFKEASIYPELSRSLAIYCRPSQHCYALYDNKKVAGICFIETNEQNQNSSMNVHQLPKGSAEITHVYVLDHAKNKGVGKRLIWAAEQVVLSMGYDKAYVRVSDENKVSQKLFAATNYISTSTDKLISTRLLGGHSFILGSN